MLEFEILARGCYRPDQLAITYNPTLRMPIDAVIQDWMDTFWEQRLLIARQHDVPLFDANLFRLVSAVPQTDGTLHLILGDTSYKEYTTTRAPEFFQGRDRQELSNAIGICSVIETSDGYILYEQRRRVAVYAGRYHVIAGFFEIERDRDAAGCPDPFRAMCREIREETGILASDIREQYCLGTVYDLTSPHAELCFLTCLTIPLAEVYRRTPEDNEVQELLALAVNAESLRDFVLEHHGNISATGEPNLLMYGAVRFGEQWLQELMGKL